MGPESRPVVNRRASRRIALRPSARIECRKGSLGLGPNLVVSALDLSETGARLVLKVPLEKGQEVELLFTGYGTGRTVKRIARVVWCAPAEGGHAVGLRFDSYIAYADLRAMAAPPRVLR